MSGQAGLGGSAGMRIAASTHLTGCLPTAWTPWNTSKGSFSSMTAKSSALERTTGGGKQDATGSGSGNRSANPASSRYRAASGKCLCDICTFTRYKTGLDPEELLRNTG